jgi:hypothetical protein
VPEPGRTVDAGVLRRAAAGMLPDYMVPAAVVVLDRLPVTANGKLDRAALPGPRFTAARGRAPASAAEAAWCGLFAEVLGLDRVGPEDSFFDLGGDSIVSIQLVVRARWAGLAVTLRQVFWSKTPAALAALTGAEASTRSGRIPAPLTWLRPPPQASDPKVGHVD